MITNHSEATRAHTEHSMTARTQTTPSVYFLVKKAGFYSLGENELFTHINAYLRLPIYLYQVRLSIPRRKSDRALNSLYHFTVVTLDRNTIVRRDSLDDHITESSKRRWEGRS